LIYGETQVLTDQFGYASFTVSCGAVVPGHYYTATATDDEGNTSEFSECYNTTQAVGASEPPAIFALHANVPNPFNPTTTISYEVGTPGRVDIVVFDTRGQRVRTLVSENRRVGSGSVLWDGRDESGKSVASGIYFYKMTAQGFESTQKMVLLK
jgi:hypothetical protein